MAHAIDLYDLGSESIDHVYPISKDDFFSEELSALRAIYNGLIEKLYELAQDTNTSFYEEWKQANKDAIDRNEKIGSVNSFIRMKDGPTLEIVWKCQQGGFKNNRTGLNEKLHPSYISKGKTHSYSEKKLEKYCQIWESPIVIKYEQIFSQIRLTYSGISESRRLLTSTKIRTEQLHKKLKEI